ncbi:WD40 repeat-like protein [Lichtheimia hyalospora FSU 10163]|nr:WD40 repeat-like protein [Lichtheimia hyalospora FSU 10163]
MYIPNGKLTRHSRKSNAESELAVPEPTDEGYVELRLEMPDFAKDWSDEQSADFALFCLQRIPPALARKVINQVMPMLNRDYISQLPYELAFHVLSFLDSISLARMASVSRHWKQISSDQALWKDFFQREGWNYDEKAINRYLSNTPPPSLLSSRRKRTVSSSSSYSRTSEEHDPLRPTLAPVPLSRTAVGGGSPSTSSSLRIRNSIRRNDMWMRLRRYAPNADHIPSPSTSSDTTIVSPTSPSRSQPLLSRHPLRSSEMMRGSISTTSRPRPLSGSSVFTNTVIERIAANRPSPRDHIKHDESERYHYDDKTDTRFINWRRLYRNRYLIDRRWREGKYKIRTFPHDGSVCYMHLEAIYCIQFDDDKIVSGSRDRTIKLWNMRTGAHIDTLNGHQASVLCLQYDDRYMFSGSSDANIIQWEWNGKSYDRIRTLTGHAESVLNLKFHGNRLVSCSKDRTVRIWDLETGTTLRVLRGHRAAVNAVQFCGNQVVSASGDRTIKLWNMETGECLRTFDSHSRGIACVEFDQDRIVSGSSDQTIKIWDANTGACLQTLVGHTDLVRTLQMNINADRIISGSYDGSLRIWSLSQARHLRSLDGQPSDGRVLNLQYDFARIVCCSNLAKIVKYDFAYGIDTQFLK